MDFNICIQCGIEIESKGIQFRGKSFCSDECCELFEEKFDKVVGPGFDDLDDDELELDDLDEDIEEDGLGYDDDPSLVKSRSPLDDDDDYEIDPDDF